MNTTTQLPQTSLTSTIQGQTPPIPTWLADADFPFKVRRFELPDAHLTYVDEGPPASALPTVLLVHGSPMWSYLYRHTVARLSQRYRVVAVDLPGFGFSCAPIADGHAFQQGSTILGQFVDRLDLRHLTVVAHATSGPMILNALSTRSHRVNALMITNSFCWSLLSSPGRLGRIARLVSSRLFGWLGVRSGFLGWLTSHLSRTTGSYTSAERRAIGHPLQTKAVRRHLANVLRSIRGDDELLQALPAKISQSFSRTPALLLFGAKDNGYHAGFLQRWKQLLVNHQVRILQNSGHFPQEDEPEEYTRAVEEFIEHQAKLNR